LEMDSSKNRPPAGAEEIWGWALLQTERPAGAEEIWGWALLQTSRPAGSGRELEMDSSKNRPPARAEENWRWALLQTGRPAGAEEFGDGLFYKQAVPLGLKRFRDGHTTNIMPRRWAEN
jgi:hypothetical protein